MVRRAAASLGAQGAAGHRLAGDRRDTLRLTLAEARSLALRSNPSLRASRLSIDVARGELRQAGVYVRDNPSADILGGRPGAALEVTQEIEVAGQRSARIAAGQASVERANASVLNTTRMTIADLDRAFYRLAAARQREALANEVRTLNERLAESAARKLAAGDISQLDANLATVEYGRSRARALAVQRERQETESELRVLLGLAPDAAVAPVVDLPAAVRIDSAAGSLATRVVVDSLSVDSLTAVALARRPDLLERAAAVRQATAQSHGGAPRGVAESGVAGIVGATGGRRWSRAPSGHRSDASGVQPESGRSGSAAR